MNPKRKIKIQEKIIDKQEQLIEQLNQTITSLIAENNQLKEQSNVEGLVVSEMMDDLVSKRKELSKIIDCLKIHQGNYHDKTIELERLKKSYVKQMRKLMKSTKRKNREN